MPFFNLVKSLFTFTEQRFGRTLFKERHPWVVLSHERVIYGIHVVSSGLSVVLLTLIHKFFRDFAE
jgi:hypothetical protein